MQSRDTLKTGKTDRGQVPLPSSGDIRSKPLSVLFEELRRRKATGTLAVRSGEITKCISLNNGQIVYATSTDSRDRLGETLVRTGKITRRNLEDATRIFRKSAGLKKLGAILVENGHLTPKELFSGLKAQVKDIIFSLFLWRDGSYQFEERLSPDIIQLNIDFGELMSEIIERIRLKA